MDRVERYRELVKQALEEIAEEVPEDKNVRTELIFDENRDHYEVMQVGWDGQYRVHGTLVHCDIVDGKIHIEHNGTYIDIAEFFVKNGVPHDQIVLGFNPPELRQYTEFAVA